MITIRESQKAPVKVLFCGAGGNLAQLRTDEERLLSELAALMQDDGKDSFQKFTHLGQANNN